MRTDPQTLQPVGPKAHLYDESQRQIEENDGNEQRPHTNRAQPTLPVTHPKILPDDFIRSRRCLYPPARLIMTVHTSGGTGLRVPITVRSNIVQLS